MDFSFNLEQAESSTLRSEINHHSEALPPELISKFTKLLVDNGTQSDQTQVSEDNLIQPSLFGME